MGRKAAAEREEKKERELLWCLGSYPKQVEVPTEADPRTRYVAEEADGAGGVSLPSGAGLGLDCAAQQEPLSSLPSHPFQGDQVEPWAGKGVLGGVCGDGPLLLLSTHCVNLHQALPISRPQFLNLKWEEWGEILKMFRGISFQDVSFPKRISPSRGLWKTRRPSRPKRMPHYW